MLRHLFAALLALVGLSITVTVNVAVRVDVRPPVPVEELGLAADHSAKAAPVAATMPRFFVSGAEDQHNEKKNVRLWDWVKLANGGQHLPNYPQETGDCVSFGAKNAGEYFLYANVGRKLIDSALKLLYPPHIYGGSRVTIGKRQLGRSPGSVGAWAADWVSTHGVLPVDTPGLPAYSGRIADEWGYSGVPQKFIDASKPFLFTTSPVKSAADVRDAVCNGYPVTIASDFGTRTIKVQDGRRVAVRNGRWPHQMCIVGYDGETGSQPYFYVLNSWGPTAHPEPMQDEPPGGFWITLADCEYIVRQGDSFAFSGFDGFPAQEFVPDFSVVGAAGPVTATTHKESTMDASFWTDGLSPDWQLPGNVLGLSLFCLGLILWLLGNVRGRRGAAAACLLALAIIPAAPVAAADVFQPNFGCLVANKAPTSATAEAFTPNFSVISTAPPVTAPRPLSTDQERLLGLILTTPAKTHTGAWHPHTQFYWPSTGRYELRPQPGMDYGSIGVYAVRPPPAAAPPTPPLQCQGGRCQLMP